jgi:hypothetical protein
MDDTDSCLLDNKIQIPTVWLERFLAKIDRSSGPNACWLWLGWKTPFGHGQYKFGPQGAVPWKAHRLAWALVNGEIPEGHHIHHKCNNPSCVNPSHLEPVTPREHVIEKTLTSVSAICAAKTHCQNGHEFNEENARFTKNGKRVCRICNSAWQKAKLAKYRETHPRLKTHCIHGHPLSGDNVYEYKTKSGVGRACRECKRAEVKRYIRRNFTEHKAKERVREKLKEGITTFSEIEKRAMLKMNPKTKEYADKISDLLS